MRTSRSLRLVLAATLALLLPMASDLAMDPACNATVTLAPGITDPANGDDKFFQQTNPGSNVMLLLDSSGSMAGMPQCVDDQSSTWGGGSSTGTTTSAATTCSTPAIPAPTGTNTVPATVTWTCTPGTGTNLGCLSGTTKVACAGLKWMESVTPKAGYADPGFGGKDTAPADDMYDCPPWGAGPGCSTVCSGNNCLYDPNAYYKPNAWSASQTSATRWTDNSGTVISRTTLLPVRAIAAGDPTSVEAGCVLRNYGTGAPIMDPFDTTKYIALPGCSSCMTSHGFYMYNAQYYTGTSGSGASKVYANSTSTGASTIFAGSFLSANPPKVLTGRIVLKKLLWMSQDNAQGDFDTVRFGLTTFGGLKSGLVPGKAVLDAAYSKAAWRSARAPMIKYLNNPGVSLATGGTPLGATLLKVGQYFSEVDTAGTSNTYFASTSGTNPKKGDWSGYLDAGFVPSSADACAVCYPACQKNSVIVITDGAPDGSESIPGNITSTTDNAKLNTDFLSGTGCPTGSVGACDVPTCTVAGGCVCPKTCACPKTCDSGGLGLFGAGTATCCPTKSSNTTATPLPKVADWFHSYNLWPTKSANSPVTLTTYVVGFNMPDASANVVHATAVLGGGTSYNAANATELASAVRDMVSHASMPETSFSAPAVDTLQTTQSSTSDAFLSRFIPNSTNTWEGHVFQAALFDEFANGCDPLKSVADQTFVPCLGSTANVNPDLDEAVDPATGKAACNKVFLVDKTCTPIGENTGKGGFYQLTDAGAVTNIEAVLPWDAGDVLSDRTNFLGKGYRSACQGDADAPCRTSNDVPRNIYTWVPVGGTLTKTAFTTANVAALKPYLSIEPAWCSALLTTINYPAASIPAALADKLTLCAKQVILYVRGYDIFNANGTGCRAPGHPGNVAACSSGGVDYGGERNRDADTRTPPLSFKLGDIFHSTPVAAHMPASVLICDLGYDPQCLTTIHSPTSLPNPTRNGGPAWEEYRAANVTRPRVVVVGANDGMLHGFDSGTPISDSSKNSPNALGTYLYTEGNGEELWAFIPPDLLPKLQRLTRFSVMEDHQYMVDGPTMVRDIWVDGSSQTSTALGGKDGVKQGTEFHTLAVVSERTGGNSYTGLDITDPANPKYLWTFPKPGSPEARQMGYSWTDFAGRPPPIGPVRLGFKTAGDKAARDPDDRNFEERWIVMLNGGYDPTLVRGRAVFMVDAWTGETIWRVTDDDLKTGGLNDLGFGSGTSMFPVPASVGLIDLGDPTRQSFDSDGFFDTATWGDLGGNLWVARFQEIGTFGASGRVENWFASRSFEQGRAAGNVMSARNRQPFFAMTANAYEPTSRTLRSFLGSGNRERLLSKGASCGQDNLMACCQAGCQVTATVSENLGGTCGWTSTFSCDSATGNMSHAAVTDSPGACAEGTSCASGGTPFAANASVTIRSCTGGPATDTVATGAATCDSTGVCSSTASTPPFRQLGSGTVTVSGTTPPPPRFFGVWAYGGDSSKLFSTLPQAQTFDANRFTDPGSAFVGTCTSANIPCKLVDTTATTVAYNPLVTGSFVVTGNQATPKDAGWSYTYQGGDEKTGAGAAVVLGCTVWSGFVASGSTAINSCTGGSTGTLTSRTYLSNYVSGVPSPSCGYADGVSTLARYTETRGVTAPPTTANVRVVMNASGRVEYSALQLAPGGSPSSKAVGTRSQVVEPVYWMEVSRDLHNCRHDAALSASTCK